MPIQILTTYAPHNGKTEEDRMQHWGEVKEILNKTCKRHMIIWRADANGQIGRDEGDGAEEHNAKAMPRATLLGHIPEQKRKGDVTRLKETCQRRNMIPMATWKHPEIEKNVDGGNIDTQKIRPRKYGKRRCATNTSPRGKARVVKQEGK